MNAEQRFKAILELARFNGIEEYDMVNSFPMVAVNRNPISRVNGISIARSS